MSKGQIIALVILLFSCLFSQFPGKDFEIVESIPVETDLDNDEIRNTDEVWLEMINNAKSTIDIEQFYIADEVGEPLEKILNAIIDKAESGVKIRVLIESKMANTYPGPIKRLKDSKNIELRILSAFKKNHGINHAKYFIIDRERVFIGSQNFDWRALKHIHEIGVNIYHKEFAETITGIFELNWQQAETNKLVETKPHGEITKYEMKINDEKVIFFPTASPYNNMPDKFYADELAIVEAISQAKRSVKIQVLSYSPSAYGEYYETLDNAIRSAAQRGVKVEMIVSDWCQHKYEVPYLKSLQILPNVDVKMTTIPEFSEKYVPYARVEHCKMMTIDDNITWIGTSNWKKNYFHASRNLGIIIESKTINSKIAEIFDKSWNSEYANLIDINKAYIPKKYGEK